MYRRHNRLFDILLTMIYLQYFVLPVMLGYHDSRWKKVLQHFTFLNTLNYLTLSLNCRRHLVNEDFRKVQFIFAVEQL